MIRIVTIAREYGSGGGSIARMLAEKLGWKLLDRELILELAKRAHCSPEYAARCDEHSPSFLSRIMHAYWMGGPDTWAALPVAEIPDADTLATTTGSIIHEAAQLGSCVIVGRGSQCVLRERADAFHVFTYAPRVERVRRLLGRRHVTERDAEAAMMEIDRIRAAYVRRYYDQDWTDRHLYHLMMNSEIGDSVVVAATLAATGLIPQTRV